MSRSERRFRTENIIKKRANKNYYWLNHKKQSWSTFYEDVKNGVHTQYIKQSGVLCSCWMCKRPRYSKQDRRNLRQYEQTTKNS